MFRKLLIPLLLCLLLTGCGGPKAPEAQNTTIFAMNTVMELSVFTDDEALLQEAVRSIYALEKSLSATDKSSDIYALNHSGSAVLPPESAELMDRALALCARTEGVLDVSIYPVVRAWGFTTGSYRIPGEDELASLLEQVDYRRISFDPASGAVSVPEGMELDLGSVAKGYAGSLLAEQLREKGVTSALLNLGGDVQLVGGKPDGSPWRVAVKDPAGGDHLGVLSVSDCAVVTSGGYERFFEGEDGRIYWHIIDSSTGRPAKSGLTSATVVGRDGEVCDALSTTLFVLGAGRAEEFWRESDDFEMILVTEDGEILVSGGLKDVFVPGENIPYSVRFLER